MSEPEDRCRHCGGLLVANELGTLRVCRCTPSETGGNELSEYSTREELGLVANKSASAVATEPIEFEAGSFPLERYRPISRLGIGAYGEVFLCHDKLLAKNVAVKRLHQLTADQLLSFQNEARATSKLNHPSIMTVLDFGATEIGVPFMVMEYFPGKSLDKVISESGQIRWRPALDLFLLLSEALDYAHKRAFIIEI
ncbi:MAG: protein kinase [Cyanobacteria bacterium]|nr:protein kinase [Cyanobacteriota bacterium]